MRLGSSLSIVALMITVALAAGCASKKPVNFGDSSPGNLWWQTYTAWKVDGNRDQALIYAEKTIELYEDEAKEEQAALSDYPPTDPPEATFEYEALNAVGVAYLLKGEILMEKGDKLDAREALKTVVNDFKYAQYRDGEQKWWKAAEVAEERLAELEANMN